MVIALCAFTAWGSWSWQQLDSVLLKGNSRLYTVAKGAKAKDVLVELAAEPVSPFWSVPYCFFDSQEACAISAWSFTPSARMTFITVLNSGLPSADSAR